MFGKLIVLGTAVLNIGTIYEADGIVERTFSVLNEGPQPVTIVQGYTSCGCTTVTFPKDSLINAGDTISVTLRFNPRGKGGEFYETAHLKTAPPQPSPSGEGRGGALCLTLTGTCITSEETMLLQHPVVVNERLRLSRDRFDLGYMSVGEERERTVSVWHRDTDTTETSTIRFVVSPETPKGLNHIPYTISIHTPDGDCSTVIMLDVVVK